RSRVSTGTTRGRSWARAGTRPAHSSSVVRTRKRMRSPGARLGRMLAPTPQEAVVALPRAEVPRAAHSAPLPGAWAHVPMPWWLPGARRPGPASAKPCAGRCAQAVAQCAALPSRADAVASVEAAAPRVPAVVADLHYQRRPGGQVVGHGEGARQFQRLADGWKGSNGVVAVEQDAPPMVLLNGQSSAVHATGPPPLPAVLPPPPPGHFAASPWAWQSGIGEAAYRKSGHAPPSWWR